MDYGVGAVVLAWMAALSYFDIRYRRLPNRLTLPGAAVVAGAAACRGSTPMLIGAVALAGLYLAVHLAAPLALGAGDVKLALSTGGASAAFGMDCWWLAAIGAPLLTGIAGVALLGVRGRDVSVPHGLSMCVATATALVLAWAP